MDYKGAPEPSQLHPLWKQWLNHARDSAPSPKDVYIWEVEQVRLQKRLKDMDEASTKMRAEDLAQRERGDADMGNAFSRLTSHLMNEDSADKPASSAQSTPKAEEFIVPPHATGPAPGSNLAFEDGKQIVPKDTKPYSPDPARLQQILNKEKFERQQAAEARAQSSASTPQFSTWDPNASGNRRNTDDL